ncbi:pre-mRNA-processing factor 19 [[Candida] anglica]|uniref:Pre-mRNA-processing factor 19 n=1 Tax=[Candida] anglica TaxID=148631 RepID=A0ABP0E6J6_9ASCO
MICSLSGEVAKEPVVSPRSGAIFEKSLIERYIVASGTDPLTDEPLSVEDLVQINDGNAIDSSNQIVPPKPPTFNSIPSLLSTFQNEWDALALEVFSLRKQLHKSREELSAALYHQDAAVRVASRLVKERDEARQALQALSISIGTSGADDVEMENDEVEGGAKSNGEEQKPTGIIPVEEINSARDQLFQLHKSQKPTLTIPVDQEVSVELLSANVAHPFKKSSCSNIVKNVDEWILVGSPTGVMAKIDKENKVEKIFKSSGQEITSICYVKVEEEYVPIISDHSKEAKLGEMKESFPSHHQDEIIKLITHPSLHHLFVSFSKDGSWSLNDVSQLKSLFVSTPLSSAITAGDIHVDGALVATGTTNGQVNIYDLTTGNSISTVQTKFNHINQLKFAGNGYWLLVLSHTTEESPKSALEVVDLRKGVVVHTIDSETPFVDFIIDPSSSIVVTVDGQHNLQLHRYLKKGKKWSNSEFTTDLKTPISSLQLLTEAQSKDFEEGVVKFITVAENSKVSEYKIKY